MLALLAATTNDDVAFSLGGFLIGLLVFIICIVIGIIAEREGHLPYARLVGALVGIVLLVILALDF